MQQDIRPAFVRDNKAKALDRIEPLYLANDQLRVSITIVHHYIQSASRSNHPR